MIILNEDKTECVIVRDDGTIFVLDETEIYEIFGEIKKHDYDSSINHVIQQTMDNNGIDLNGNEVLRKILVDEVAELLDESIENSEEIKAIIRDLIKRIATELTLATDNAFKKISN